MSFQTKRSFHFAQHALAALVTTLAIFPLMFVETRNTNPVIASVADEPIPV
jgi:hypothetical protein